MAFTTARFGWIHDLPDQRDHLYAAPHAMLTALPSKVDLRPHCPPVYDQGNLGSCTANGIAGAIEFDRMKQKLQPAFTPSRLFIYYNERVKERSIRIAERRFGMESRWWPKRAIARKRSGRTTFRNLPISPAPNVIKMPANTRRSSTSA